jgi:uncharacterized membrane-anchored protein YhcB (DUF1043 family)
LADAKVIIIMCFFVQILDETMKKKLADEVENIRVEFDEKFRLVEDQKEELAKKLKDSETVTKTTQRQLEQTQSELYDAANKLAQKSDAKSEEVEMLLNDLESSNQRAILAEKEVESLKEQMKSGSLFISSLKSSYYHVWFEFLCGSNKL